MVSSSLLGVFFARISTTMRGAAVGVALACAGPALVGCATTQSKAEEKSAAQKHYEIAVGSFHSGLFEDAKLQLRRALVADPTHADSHYLSGVLLLQEGKTMMDALEISQCLTDEAAAAQRERGQELHRQAHASFEEAAKHYDVDASGRGRAFNSMAVVSLHFLANDRAVAEAKQALDNQYYNEKYSALANLGWAYHGAGRSVEATTELRQAVLINPEYCVAHYRLSQVYLEQGLMEQALEHAEKVLSNNQCPIQDAYRIAGVARMRQGQTAAAADAFSICVSLAPRSCLARECQRFVMGGEALAHGG